MSVTPRDPYLTPRRRMVERLAQQGIASPRVLDAMTTVPRELFVPVALRGRAYDEGRLPIGEGQTISAPWTVARMSELVAAGAPAGAKVLEIGTGSGYQAAVLGAMGLIVYSVERHAPLAREAAERLRTLGYLSVSVNHFDGTYGWAAWAPYRVVLVTAAAPDVPAPLLKQMEEGGRLVLPLARGKEHRLTVVTRHGDGLRAEDHGAADFVPLVGKFGYAPGP